MTDRPDFTLMRQTDIQSVYHMQMPRGCFPIPAYADGLSLDAKVTYTFLLNRFQLSRRERLVNENGEVFVIFPRKALAAELRICEQRVTAAFRQLSALAPHLGKTLRARRRQSDLSCPRDARGGCGLRMRALPRAADGKRLRFKNLGF
jgi:hypothetical protein